MDSEPDSYTIAARITDEARLAVEAKISEWFGHTTEHEDFALEDVRQMYREAR